MSQSGKYASAGPTPGSAIEYLTGNTGGAVGPTAGNVNILGSGTVAVAGDPATSTLTISVGGAVSDSFPTDSGTATPSGGVLNILGGHDINTAGSGNTVTVALNNAITLGDLSAIAPGTAGLTLVTGDIVTDNSNVYIGNDNNDTSTALLNLRKSRSGGVITTGDQTGQINFSGYDGTNYIVNAGITAFSSGTIAANRVAGNLGFYTHPDSTSAAAERLYINSVGNVLIHAPDSGNPLTVTSLPTNTVTAVGALVIDSSGNLGTQTALAVAQGGTGATSLTAHSLLLGQGTSAVTALGAATNGQIPIGSTGADPVLATLTAGTNITITNGPGSITIAASGGGSGITTIDGDSGSVTGSTVTLTGGSSGAVFTGSSATMTQSFNYLSLPTTTSSVGHIAVNSQKVFHNYGTGNVFIGDSLGNAGNFTLTTATSKYNQGIGAAALTSLTSGTRNTALGLQALQTVNSGSDNIGIGYSAGFNLAGGSQNVLIGYQAGLALVSSNGNICIGYNAGSSLNDHANNICIGNIGGGTDSGVIRLGSGSQTSCYVAGVYGVNVGSVATVATVVSGGQLGSATIAAGSGITVTPTANTITIAASGGSGGAVFIALITGVSTITYYRISGNGSSSTAISVEAPMPRAGTFQNAYINVYNNSATSGSVNFTLTVNGSAAAVTIAVGAGSTGTFSDTTHTVSVSAGDLVCWQTSPATGGTVNGYIAVEFA